MIKINKNRLIKLINLNTNVNKKIIERVFNSLIDNIVLSLKNHSKIEIYKLGTFELKELEPKAHTPNKHRHVKYDVKFTPSYSLIKILNGYDKNITEL